MSRNIQELLHYMEGVRDMVNFRLATGADLSDIGADSDAFLRELQPEDVYLTRADGIYVPNESESGILFVGHNGAGKSSICQLLEKRNDLIYFQGSENGEHSKTSEFGYLVCRDELIALPILKIGKNKGVFNSGVKITDIVHVIRGPQGDSILDNAVDLQGTVGFLSGDFIFDDDVTLENPAYVADMMRAIGDKATYHRLINSYGNLEQSVELVENRFLE